MTLKYDVEIFDREELFDSGRAATTWTREGSSTPDISVRIRIPFECRSEPYDDFRLEVELFTQPRSYETAEELRVFKAAVQHAATIAETYFDEAIIDKVLIDYAEWKEKAAQERERKQAERQAKIDADPGFNPKLLSTLLEEMKRQHRGECVVVRQGGKEAYIRSKPRKMFYRQRGEDKLQYYKLSYNYNGALSENEDAIEQLRFRCSWRTPGGHVVSEKHVKSMLQSHAAEAGGLHLDPDWLN